MTRKKQPVCAKQPSAPAETESSASHRTEPLGAEQDNRDGSITIWPLRSYLDQGEVRRAGGRGYRATRHYANQLIALGLATDSEPQD